MMRNDYRRALILLRGNEGGYSSHVRLERRTQMGSMYFQVQAMPDCAQMRAALVGRDKKGYYACKIGDLQMGSRGQAVLSYSFDPRNICGHVLEEYQLIIISCADDDCSIVLWGNVCGHADVNWERVKTALCGLYADGIARQESVQAIPPENTPAPAASVQEIQEEIREEILDEQQDVIEDIIDNDPDRPQTAGEILNIDMNLPWPESIEPVRSLFQVSVPMENPPDEEYTYIAAAMPPESGYAYSAIGVRVQDGAPASVRYGLPAAWTASPPAGLEDYSWAGDGNRGWWMIQIDF